MKTVTIKYGKKQIIITKDFVKILVGAAILVCDALLAGVIQLFEVGFDTSYLLSSSFWSGYFIKLAIYYIALFGAYIIRKVIDSRTPKFVVQRQKIKDCKAEIVKHKKIGNCKNWLKFIYNYTKKVEIYQDIITKKYEKLVYSEPEKPVRADFDSDKKFNKAVKKYNKQVAKYKKTEETRKYCEKQLNVCEKHFEIIKCYKTHDIETVKRLQAEIKEIDHMKNCNLHYKPVTYNKLFNVDLTTNKRDDSIEYSEASILIRKILPAIFMGIVSCALLTSILVRPGEFTGEVVLLIFLNLLMMLWFIFTGVRIADSFVLGTVFAADGNRLMICEEYMEDSALNGDNWVQEIDTNAEPGVFDGKIESTEPTEMSPPEVEPMENIHIPKIPRGL